MFNELNNRVLHSGQSLAAAGMGTKLDYYISLLPNPQSNCGFNLNSVHEWDFFRNQLLKSNSDCPQLQKSYLDRTTMEQQNLECIKKVILMHEDIFKHQVRELHRLYSVQKLLMNEIKQQPTLSDMATQSTSCSCPDDNSSLRRFNLESPAAYAESSTRIFMSSQQGLTQVNNGGCGVDEEAAEVELTLRIGVGGSSSTTANKNNKRFRNEQMSCNYDLDCSSKSTSHNRIGSSSSVKSDRGGECTDVDNTMSSSSRASDEERKRPHWFFRSLSLNNKT